MLKDIQDRRVRQKIADILPLFDGFQMSGKPPTQNGALQAVPSDASQREKALLKMYGVTMRAILLTTLLILLVATTQAAEPTYLYNAKFVQAAPGKLLELIELHKARLPVYQAS